MCSPTLPCQILEVPDGHRAPAPPQNGSCDHPLLLLEPGNLASSPSMPLASPQPSSPTSHEDHQDAMEELASMPNDKGKQRGQPCVQKGHHTPSSRGLAFHSYESKR